MAFDHLAAFPYIPILDYAYDLVLFFVCMTDKIVRFSKFNQDTEQERKPYDVPGILPLSISSLATPTRRLLLKTFGQVSAARFSSPFKPEFCLFHCIF